jgi:hypothetical protein
VLTTRLRVARRAAYLTDANRHERRHVAGCVRALTMPWGRVRVRSDSTNTDIRNLRTGSGHERTMLDFRRYCDTDADAAVAANAWRAVRQHEGNELRHMIVIWQRTRAHVGWVTKLTTRTASSVRP